MFLVLVAAASFLAVLLEPAEAQRRRRTSPPAMIEAPALSRYPPPMPALPEVMPPETVQADVSTRSVSVTSSFTGTEIVVFGAVDNSRQASSEAGIYDVVIVLEGIASRVVTRRKSNVAGIWVNTRSATFDGVPSYYAIATTRPLEEIADRNLLTANEIGFEQIKMIPIATSEEMPAADRQSFREAVIRLKHSDGLYVQEDYGVVFIGRSLFRTTIDLPANVPVGPLVARVYLFRDGQLLSKYTSRVTLEREGIERWLHDFAFNYSFLYGIFTVIIAVGAGLLASRLFRRGAH
jgi:uncharacterized protein (TIGR02186 family)